MKVFWFFNLLASLKSRLLTLYAIIIEFPFWNVNHVELTFKALKVERNITIEIGSSYFLEKNSVNNISLFDFCSWWVISTITYVNYPQNIKGFSKRSVPQLQCGKHCLFGLDMCVSTYLWHGWVNYLSWRHTLHVYMHHRQNKQCSDVLVPH